MIRRLANSFSFMVLAGIIFGLITGGIPFLSAEISTIALFIAMTFSLTHINMKHLHFKRKDFIIPFLVNFGFLSTVILFLGTFFPADIWNGFVIMAAVPPAVAVIPVTKILGGDMKYSLMSLTILYVVSLALTPLIIYVLLGKNIEILTMIRTIILLIVLPLILSQFIMRLNISTQNTSIITNICFFILIFILVGKNRLYLFREVALMFWIAVATFLRTFGTGSLLKIVLNKMSISHERQISLILLSSVKNEGFAIILALSLFNDISVVPPVIAIIFELMLYGCFETNLCGR